MTTQAPQKPNLSFLVDGLEGVQLNEAGRVEDTPLQAAAPAPAPAAEPGQAAVAAVAEPGAPAASDGTPPAPAKAEATPPKPAEPAAKPVEEPAKSEGKTQAEKDQEYIHRLHMERVQQAQENAALKERLAIFERANAAQLTPEEIAEKSAEEKLQLMVERAAEKKLDERRNQELERQATVARTTPDNLRKLMAAREGMAALDADHEQYPMMKDEAFQKFFRAGETLQKVVEPVVKLAGRRDEMEVLRDSVTWDAVYNRTVALFNASKAKPATVVPTPKVVALAGAVQPAPATPAAAPARSLADDDDWKAVKREAAGRSLL